MSAWGDFMSCWSSEEQTDDHRRKTTKRLKQDALERAKALCEVAEKASQQQDRP